MPALPSLTGPTRPPVSGRPARKLVVLLHGVGADGHDLIDLADQWAPRLPDAAFIAPNAPDPCDMAPMGHQWFSLRDWSMASLSAGVQAAAPVLAGFLEAQRARYDLPWSKVALVGFSQGTIMALHVAPRLPEPVACVVGFSGALVAAELLGGQVRARPPVLLVHGDQDEVVPVGASVLAARTLGELGFKAELTIRPGLGHWIDAEGMGAAAAFLSDSLGK